MKSGLTEKKRTRLKQVLPHIEKWLDANFERLKALDDEKGYPLSACLLYTQLGQAALLEEGFKTRMRGGKAAFAFNNGAYDMLDYGYSMNSVAHPLNAALGFHGHLWLELKDEKQYIDFVVPHIPRLAREDDLLRGTTTSEIKIPLTPLINMSALKSWEELRYQLKIGLHYALSAELLREGQNRMAIISQTGFTPLPYVKFAAGKGAAS